MPLKVVSPRSGRTFFFVLVAAAAGQGFLAQADQTWALLPGLLFYAWALWKLGGLPSPSKIPSKPLSGRIEGLVFTFILCLGFSLRIFRLDSLPSGMHTDQGLMGLPALRIAFGGWRPFFEVFNYHVPEVGMYYQLAAWFKLLGSSYWTFHLFFVLFSILAFPLVYWTFRQLSGPRVALLSLFILAVMRWHMVFSRNGFPTIQVPFYLFGTLAFWLYWREQGKSWALVLSALFCGLGLYTYQSFKIVPFLILTYAVYEFLKNRAGRAILRGTPVFFIVVGIVAAPLLWYMFQQRSLGIREGEVFIGHEIAEDKSLLPALDEWARTALMFNRTGDANPRHNIPGRRMLDDITGVFFMLGLAAALRRRGERDSFYPLAGFFVMSLPCLLSSDPAHSNRMLAVTPFVAFLAASPFDYFWRALGSIPRWKPLVSGAAFLLLALAAAQNAYTYFVVQDRTYACWKGYGPEQTFIGRTVERLEKMNPGNTDYFVTPAYFPNATVAYLGYPAGNRLRGLQVPADLNDGVWPRDRDAVFFLEEGKSGLLNFLETVLPGGQEERLKDWDGRTLVFAYRVPRQGMASYRGWNRGLRGEYFNSFDGKNIPVAVRWDPVLNFTGNSDFPFRGGPPFFIRWRGSLVVPVTGYYRLQILGTDWAQVQVDGRKVFVSQSPQADGINLTRGRHPIRIEFRKKEGRALAFHLVWMRPGLDHWEIVPATAFGKIP